MDETTAGFVASIDGSALATITLAENLELDEIPELLAAARAALGSGCGILVDCRAPDFLPTGALQILVALQRACRERDVPFAVEGVQESAAGYLRLAGLDAILCP